MNLLNAAIGYIGGINECITLFDWARSKISFWGTQQNGTQEQQPQDDVLLQLQSDLRSLEETLPTMHELIDRAEWRSHKDNVAKLLPNLKDAVYDAEDLLDEFRWYDMKVRVEGDAAQLSPFIDFFHSVTHGNFNKVSEIQKRLSSLCRQVEMLGLHEATPRFDKSLRPVTTSSSTEPKIFGREKDIEEVIRLLGVPNHSIRTSSKRKRTSNAANNEPVIASVPVLPIVGMGGVGKTTLAQAITTIPRVKSHFDKIIWICVSDDFDEERFTKVLIKSLSGKEATTNNLDDLQRDLGKKVGKKRFLLVLDDIWPDALKDGQLWRKFCAPFTNVLQGSMLLVTTRFVEVADIAGTMESFTLEGLKDDVFWDFFKLCVFGAEDAHIDPDLELIGRCILPKLKGTPLAAKTIGRLLQKSLNTAHWNGILNNELWQIEQKKTDILPALRLSYVYLPFHLKRCFSFCAVYPKDYNFRKDSLAEIWVAEGFVEPQGSIPLQDIGCQYFEDLVNLSFFQKLRGAFVIHDLMHDMAQLVSKEECFIVKDVCDIKNIPQNVRHLSILASSEIKSSDIRSLSKHTKLHTLLCYKSLSNLATRVINCWFSELRCLRVIHCTSLWPLPESIGNQKHLRYLEISRDCYFHSIPSSFCNLYNLQTLYARKCRFGTLPSGVVSKMINLQKFESSRIFRMEVDAAEWEEGIQFIEKFNQIAEDLIVDNLGAISKDRAAELEVMKKQYLNSLTLRWSTMRCPEHNETEVLQALQPPTNIKSVHLNGYPGEDLPSWFRDSDAPDDNSNGAIFSSLTELGIEGCQNVSSLEHLLHPDYVPALKKILIKNCTSVTSVPVEWFQYLPSLEELVVRRCPKMKSGLSAPSLKNLELQNSGNLAENIECSSLTTLHVSCEELVSIELHKWSLPVLQKLTISFFRDLTFIRECGHSNGGATSSTGKFPLLTQLTIGNCEKLETLDDLLTHEYLPAIESITIRSCQVLSLSTERFESFPFLKNLCISECQRLNWKSGMVFPASLRSLTLWDCGDFSAGFPSCLKNLTSLESLTLLSCKGIVSIQSDLWSDNLKSLKKLKIQDCPDLVSIGGPRAVANINAVHIRDCPKLKELQQPLRRGKWWYVCHLIAL